MTESLLNLSIDELRKRHADLYRKIMPTLESYSKMATEAVSLQKEMYHRWVLDLEPIPQQLDTCLICSFSVKETPATVTGILGELFDKKVQVDLVVYDERRMEYFLFGRAPQVPHAQGEQKQEVTNG